MPAIPITTWPAPGNTSEHRKRTAAAPHGHNGPPADGQHAQDKPGGVHPQGQHACAAQPLQASHTRHGLGATTCLVLDRKACSRTCAVAAPVVAVQLWRQWRAMQACLQQPTSGHGASCAVRRPRPLAACATCRPDYPIYCFTENELIQVQIWASLPLFAAIILAERGCSRACTGAPPHTPWG